MSEFDFNELLDGFLRQDARVEPRRGMEQRVLAGVFADARQAKRRWRMWSVIAASTAAVSLIVWAVGVNAPSASYVHKMSLSASQSQALPMGSEKKVAKHETSVVRNMFSVSERKPCGHLSRTGRPDILLREERLRVRPLEIVPLTIEPMEISSLTAEREERKGEVR